MRIDVHTHFQCLEFVKHIHGRSMLPKSLLEGGTYVVQCAAGLSLPSLPKIIDMEKKLRDMEDLKIDVAVLSHGLPFGPNILDDQQADNWAERINDNLAEIIDRYPGKFVGFGSISFGDRQRSIAEVDRCIMKLGFKGIQIFSNISNKLLDSEKFVPILKHIAELGVAIHLHPAIPLNRIGLNSSTQFLPLGFPYDTSLNVVRLIQSGLFDETPDLKLIVAHAGGVIPYLWGRIRTYNAPSPFVTDPPQLRQPIEYYLSKLYVDTVCYHIEALKCCYDVMGAEHLLYGTDHPFGRYDVAAELIEQLDCPASDRDLIYSGNAKRLLNRKDLNSETDIGGKESANQMSERVVR
jgi:predicted TIM-barrel fold metal-dependent hydrolase